jgi:predicted  nucleic acid-binding Zn-ribbon protein
LAAFTGKCGRCGREYYADSKVPVVCGCWEQCPQCGERMEPYVPDLVPSAYGKDGKRDLLILRVCNNSAVHADKSSFYSEQKPVEVELSQGAKA